MIYYEILICPRTYRWWHLVPIYVQGRGYGRRLEFWFSMKAYAPARLMLRISLR